MDTSNTERTSNCDCGTGQTQSEIACPVCRKLGRTVNPTTPRHTLTRTVRDKLNAEHHYHFCENPDCDVVYYNNQDTSVFTTSELKNAVTIKDESPETPLCYCFKVLKKQALEDIARTGTTNVFQHIQSKMKSGQSCFCEKANPRGDTCTQDIQRWLVAQGITDTDQPSIPEINGCCGPNSASTSSGGRCCG